MSRSERPEGVAAPAAAQSGKQNPVPANVRSTIDNTTSIYHMTNSLAQLCTPRDSVFDRNQRDTVLDITDLIDDKIDAERFFEENYVTDGMRRLLRESFRRFDRETDAQGVFVLTQAMGGGKTHNMISLGLLAKHPELRKRVMGSDYTGTDLGKVRVVGFTGRESDAPYGIWGAIAEQLGKKELFNDYYSPLQAPGQTAWINLLKGEPLLILLDELPPYFEAAKSRTIGNSDLAAVTTTALSNLLVAVGKPELKNVCVVISDLRATYQGGSQQVAQALNNFENEVRRGALMLEPVGANTNEVYHILRKRLFDELPGEAEIAEVANAYGQAVRDAKQMDVTNASPEQFAAQLRDSYPFHFSIRDLYARFRENPGFQQTRGLIRLMRTLVARLYGDGGRANEIQLIHPYDLDLNDRETLIEVATINPKLENAIAHDIASEGQSVAETIDRNLGGGRDAQDASTLLLIASLANVPNALRGLSLPEIVSFMCAPGRDVSRLKDNVLSPLGTKAWYLHGNSEGKLFFRDVQNLVAKLNTTAKSYNRESQMRELREFLAVSFIPALRDCYQEVQTLPALDQIQLAKDRVTLVIPEPHPAGGLAPELRAFYADADYPNRVLFLAGERNTMDRLLESAAELRAIGAIIQEMDAEGAAPNDPQRTNATDIQDRIRLQLLSAARETFTKLYYPQGEELLSADFLMQFTDNDYNGEKQIRQALKAAQKFTEDVASDTFRMKCEQRLFTQQQMPWGEVKNRAARNPKWQWHKPGALDDLKDELVRRDQWRETGGYVDKGPFPPPVTGVRVQQLARDLDTGEVTLKLTPVHGDTLFYEVGGPATAGSLRVEDPQQFRSAELELSFLCVDADGEHQTGEPVAWRNTVTLQSRVYQQGSDKMVELKAAPPAPIRYTTDGSNPRVAGGVYEGPFAVPRGTRMVLAVAEKNAIASDEHRRDIDWENTGKGPINVKRPATWKRQQRAATTKEAYEFLSRLKRHEARAFGARATVTAGHWLELSFDEGLPVAGETLEAMLEHLRGLITDGEVSIEALALDFPTGQHLLDWVAEVRTELEAGEVQQT